MLRTWVLSQPSGTHPLHALPTDAPGRHWRASHDDRKCAVQGQRARRALLGAQYGAAEARPHALLDIVRSVMTAGQGPDRMARCAALHCSRPALLHTAFAHASLVPETACAMPWTSHTHGEPAPLHLHVSHHHPRSAHRPPTEAAPELAQADADNACDAVATTARREAVSGRRMLTAAAPARMTWTSYAPSARGAGAAF